MSVHQLLKLTQSLYSRPHLINQTSFNFISSYLNNRNLMKPSEMPVKNDEEDSPDDMDDFDPESGVGVIEIQGAISYKPIYGMCGEVGCSYTSILDKADELIESGAKIIILNIDSGGGEGYGCFETANELRKKCDENEVILLAYNDGLCASAAYGLACVADEVISNPYAETGSIGVLICLCNDSKALEEEGYSRSFIYAGSNKVPYDETGGWKESFLKDLQTKVDSLFLEFVSHVNRYTGIDAKTIRGFEASTFQAKDALDNGLVNQIMTRSQFIDYVVSKLDVINKTKGSM